MLLQVKIFVAEIATRRDACNMKAYGTNFGK